MSSHSNAQGNAQFKIGVYTYSASENIDRVLFYTFGNQSVSFYAGIDVCLSIETSVKLTKTRQDPKPWS